MKTLFEDFESILFGYFLTFVSTIVVVFIKEQCLFTSFWVESCIWRSSEWCVLVSY